MDRGERHGLVPEVELEPVAGTLSARVTITSVAATSAIASLRTYASDCESLQMSMRPTTDWQLTTGAFDLVGANQKIAAVTTSL